MAQYPSHRGRWRPIHVSWHSIHQVTGDGGVAYGGAGVVLRIHVRGWGDQLTTRGPLELRSGHVPTTGAAVHHDPVACVHRIYAVYLLRSHPRMCCCALHTRRGKQIGREDHMRLLVCAPPKAGNADQRLGSGGAVLLCRAMRMCTPPKVEQAGPKACLYCLS